MTKLWGCCGVPSAGLPHTSLTCSRCRSYVELIPPPPKSFVKEPTPELTPNCEPDGETGFIISVCPRKSLEQESEGQDVSYWRVLAQTWPDKYIFYHPRFGINYYPCCYYPIHIGTVHMQCSMRSFENYVA